MHNESYKDKMLHANYKTRKKLSYDNKNAKLNKWGLT